MTRQTRIPGEPGGNPHDVAAAAAGASPERAHVHEEPAGTDLADPKPAQVEEDSPAYWWHTIQAREADLKRACVDEEKARQASGEALLRNGVPNARLLGEVAKASAMVSSLEDAIRQGKLKLLEAEEAERLRRAQAVHVEGKAIAKQYLAESAKLQDAVETLAAHYLQTFEAGAGLVRAITKAKHIVPPEMRNDGRVIAGDAREALAVAKHLSDRVQIEIARRVGLQMWPSRPDADPGVLSCPLSEQHNGIVHNALVELAATLNLEA